MAELHHLVLLAQRLAEGRRLHPSNAAFGQWVKDNGFDHLTHRDRAALLSIAQLDPQEASHHINRSSYTTPEHLWYRVLRHLAVRKTTLVPVRKTEPEPEVEVCSTEQIKEFLKRLETLQPGSYQFIYEEVLTRSAGRYMTLPDIGVGAWGRKTLHRPSLVPRVGNRLRHRCGEFEKVRSLGPRVEAPPKSSAVTTGIRPGRGAGQADRPSIITMNG